MGVYYETIPKSAVQWIHDQKAWWVATAPLSGKGHVNVSPKGGASGKFFGVLNERQFWYMDLSGSGNETISHLLEPGNGRITIMFNAFEGPPKIIRLWGQGHVLENGTSQFASFVETHNIETLYGSRSIILVDIDQVGSSCGFSVPYYDFKDFRPILNDFFANKERKYKEGKTEESMDRYWAYKNSKSMDGLPGMQRGMIAAKRENIAPIKKMVGRLARTRYQIDLGFGPSQVMLVAFVSFLFGVILAVFLPVLLTNRRFYDLPALVSHGFTQLSHR